MPSQRGNVRFCTSSQLALGVPSLMVPEGTPGKWSLLATHPKRLGSIAELFATTAAAAARAGDLRRAGYTVEIFLSRPDPIVA
jgi:hypothetical protein